MSSAIAVSNEIAATLARLVSGKVRVVFFDESARCFDFTGKTLDEIQAKTSRIRDGGCTSIGVGLDAAMKRGWEIDGIAIVTDGGENRPPIFRETYARFEKDFGKPVPVYVYGLGGFNHGFVAGCEMVGIDVQLFDLTRGKVDHYSILNLVQTMRTNRHSLVDDIYATPLLTLDEVFLGAA